MTLFYQELIHLSLSLLAGFIIYRFYKNRWSFIFALASGFFVDVDHWFDNWIAYGPNLNIVNFLSGSHFSINHKLYIPFHGWEYIVILFLAGYELKKYRPIFYALGLSLFFHLSFDVFSNHVSPENYSILYRILNDFKGL